MKRKILSGIITTALITSVLSVSAFAVSPVDLKQAKTDLKANNAIRKQSVDSLKQAVEAKRVELGIVKLTSEQKEQVKSLQEQMKALKTQVKTLKQQLKEVTAAKDTDSAKAIREQLKGIKAQMEDVHSKIIAITGGKKENPAQIKDLKNTLKGMHEQKKPLIEEARMNCSDIKALYEQLKAAKKAGDIAAAEKIINQIIEKSNVQAANFQQRAEINNQTIETINK